MRYVFCLFLAVFYLSNYSFAQDGVIKLPSPLLKGKTSVEEAIQNRRSIRSFKDEPLGLADVSQLLWASGGITVDGVTGPTRSYPSAGGIYPLSIYLMAGNVKGLEPGIYKYNQADNALLPLGKGDMRGALSKAAFGQEMVADAPISIIIMADTEKTESRYGAKGAARYVPMDAGHSGENVHLQAYALGLGACMVGAFDDGMVRKMIGDDENTPVYIIPVGKYGRK